MKFSLFIFFLFVFIACFCYDDPYTSLSRRLIYSGFLYLSIWQIILFKIWKLENLRKLKVSKSMDIYYVLIGLFVLIYLISDFINPTFKIVTLLNNPLALVMIVPVFTLEIGYLTEDISKIFKLFFYISFIFILVCLLPISPELKYFEGNMSGYVILPVIIYFFNKKKYLPYLITLLAVLIIFSFISDIRTIFLRIILFSCLIISLTIFKKSIAGKVFILIALSFIIFQALANMQFYLDLFASHLHIKQFDADDTRTFLYTELFSDLNLKDLLIGKGFLGTYFSEYFLMIQKAGETNGDHFIRFSVEVGFLELILKGGFTLYVLFTFPLLYAAIKGIFKGYNNKLVFMFSVYILNEIYLMFFENIPSFTLNYFILFFLSGYVLKKTRNIKSDPKVNGVNHLLFIKNKPVLSQFI